jgi:CelD/BcsL family acetyltransferase involved in cellulose biosynthesis
MNDFTESHIKRWENTSTPSNLTDIERSNFFNQCHKAWIEDGLLVRFSIMLDGRRIGFVIALRENNSLIHHSTTYDIDYQKYSPGLVIIRLMVQWMAAQNICKLDFGDGDESYKFLFSNKNAEINRIYLSSNSNLAFILKAKITKAVRENPNVHKFYLKQIKPLAQKVFS